tara:strand:+ start:82 stop:729 length:648 start_codon:yes stop_codon:yes gene_type:complete
MSKLMIDLTSDDPPPIKRRKAESGELTPVRLRKELGLVRHYVMPDGSCWIYIFMAATGSYRAQSSNASGWSTGKAYKRTDELIPSEEELAIADRLRSEVADKQHDPALKNGPVYNDEGLQKVGEYGGTTDFPTLCKILDDQAPQQGLKHYAVNWMLDQSLYGYGKNPDALVAVTSSDGTTVLNLQQLQKLLQEPTTKPIHFTVSSTWREHFDVLL